MNLRRFGLSSLVALSAVSLAATLTPTARANDGMFPAAPAAKSAIDYDGKGFMVNGKRTFIVSAGLEYARIPRAMWRDRLLRIKRGGFNCVEIYVFWNFHEPQEGKWNFSGDHDLNAFLKMVHEVGLYATVRVGPYVCAEWDSGGYPVWLRFKPDLGVREVNAPFQAAVDRYLEKIMPIVAANQIHKGGAVVMVQLENEHTLGWGTEMPNDYFRHLREKAVSLGLEVPYFFSGLHHSSDPAGNRPWDSVGRTNPWYSTEFWTDWYDKYGDPSAHDTTFEDRATWKIIAYGGNGYNYYMLHGGTNFDHFNNNEDSSSYDYGSAIGQAGDLRGTYYKFKRAALFATSFPDILENSTNSTEEYKGIASNPAVHVTARTSTAGTIVFLDNPTDKPVETNVKFPGNNTAESGSITLAAGEIVPLLHSYAITPEVTIDTFGRVLGLVRNGNETTLITYGSTPSRVIPYISNSPTLANVSGDNPVDKTAYLGGTPASGVRILHLTPDEADKTYFVESGGKTYILTGLPYVGDASYQGGKWHVQAETPSAAIAPAGFRVYGAFGATTMIAAANISVISPSIPALQNWQVKSAAREAQASFDDKSWKSSDAPLPMGADGDDGAFAWYRTKVSAPKAGAYTLRVGSIRDRAEVWVDGVLKPATVVHGNGIALDLTAGAHSVAIFTAHYGRDKLFGHMGPIDTIDAKGLNGPARLQQTGSDATTLSGWRYQMTDRAHRNAAPPAVDSGAWKTATIGDDVFDKQRGYAWYQTTLPAVTGGQTTGAVLHFDGVDDNGTIYFNGVKIGQHSGWNEAFDVAIPAGSLHTDGTPNVVSVLVENTDNTGGLAAPVSLATYAYDAPVTGWKMRGGTTDPIANDGWTAFTAGSAPANGPRIYRTTFTATAPAATGPHPILRATFAGLSHGFMYLNGHNLGRYPEKVPIDGIYLPECWLAPSGHNTLTVLDEDGVAPTGVHLEIEAAASRVVTELTASAK